MKKIFNNDIYLYNYNSAKDFCIKYRPTFNGFTKFQEYILQEEQFWNQEINLIIKGMPGTGKTLLAEISLFSTHLKHCGETRKMLYLVPYRALLNEKYSYFIDKYDRTNYRIYRSSSDYFDNDENIISAECEIAIMIYEKLDNALLHSSDALNIFFNYDLIIMDEFSLISSMDRGVVVNSILERYNDLKESNKNKKISRIIALTIPECITSEYKQYGFITLVNDSRDIEIREAIIQADKGLVIPRDNITNWPISYEKLKKETYINLMEEEIQNYEEIKDEFFYYENKDLLLYIIKAHRKMNHNIIIFCSSRENAKNLSNRISNIIYKDKIPHGDWSERLTSIKKNMGDNSYGCIDDKMLLSSRHGVVYHNSDLPIELRREIEKEFCKKNGSRINIIVCTETLAYGINCSADVVIIYERIKPTSNEDFPNFQYGSNAYMRYLNSVEYQNFIGRAGRLGYGEGKSDHCGYAYLFSKDYNGTRKLRERYYDKRGRRFRSAKQLFTMKLWRNPITTVAIVFDEIQTNKKNGFNYDELERALNRLTGKRKILRKDVTNSKLVNEMKRLQLIDEDEKEGFIFTRVGESIHGARISYEEICGLNKIMDNLKNNGFSNFFLLFQVCGIIHNSNICYLSRKKVYLRQLGVNISKFFDYIEISNLNNKNMKTLHHFEKNVNKKILDLREDERGYTYLSEKLSNELHQFQNAATLYLWGEGISIEKINKEYGLPARIGAIINLSKNIIHILDCLIKYLNSYIDVQQYAQQVQEEKIMIKYGMPYCCVEALNFQIELSIRPEICKLIENRGKLACADVLKKFTSLNKLSNNLSFVDIMKQREFFKQKIKEL